MTKEKGLRHDQTLTLLRTLCYFLLICKVAIAQDGIRTKSLPNGGFIVAYSGINDASDTGVFAQIYDNIGVAIGSAFQVNTFTASIQRYPSIGIFSNGGFVISWESYFQKTSSGIDAYATRYDAAGTPVTGEFPVTSSISGSTTTSIATFADGRFVIVWKSYGQDASSSYGIYAQRYDANNAKIGSEFRVNTYTANNQLSPSISAFSDGGFIVVWKSENQGGSDGIYGQRYDSNGNPVDSEFKINTNPVDSSTNPQVQSLADDGFIVVWSRGIPGPKLYAQRYSSTGTQIDSEFLVNAPTWYSAMNPSVSACPGGGYIIVWEARETSSSSLYRVRGKRYGTDYAAIGSEFPVNDTVSDSQTIPSVACLPSRDFIVAYLRTGSSSGLQALIHKPLCPSISCKTCSDLDVCDSCNDGYDLENGLCIPIVPPEVPPEIPPETPPQHQTPPLSSLGAAGAAASSLAQVSVVLTMVSSPGNSAAMSVAVLCRMLEYVKYINVSHSPRLEEYIQDNSTGPVDISFTPDLPETFVSEHGASGDLPEIFAKYELPSNFLINFWEELFQLLVQATIFALFFVFEKKLIKYRRVANISRRLRLAFQNMILAAFYGSFGDVIFFSMLQFRSTERTVASVLLGLFIAIFILIACLLALLYHAKLLYIQQKINKQGTEGQLEEFFTNYEGCKVLFENFKNEHISQQSFALVSALRDIIFSLILSVLFQYPLPEAVIIILLNILMILYLLLRRPFKDIIESAQQLVGEISVFLVNISILILSIHDKGDYNIALIDGACMIIVLVGTAYNISVLVFLVLKAGLAVYQFCKARRQNKNKMKLHSTASQLDISTQVKTDERGTKNFTKAQPTNLNVSYDSTINDSVVQHLRPVNGPVGFDNSPLRRLNREINSPSIIFNQEMFSPEMRRIRMARINRVFNQ